MKWFLLITILLLSAGVVGAQIPCEFAPQTVQAYSVVTSTNTICLFWPSNYLRTQIFISRRNYTNNANYWQNWTGLYADTSATATSASNYCDLTVSNAVPYEYMVETTGTNWSCDGGVTTNRPVINWQYINAGVNLPLKDDRGKLILLVDSGVQASIATELTQLTNDLIGDGYKVYQYAVAANDVTNASWATSVATVKTLVTTNYASDPTVNWTLFIVGHVPIPYSGESTPGGHVDNVGAHPADWYYCDTNASHWTDSTVNNSTATFTSMYNVPGDGKFDQSQVPAIPMMRLGRVDLYGMSSFTQTYAQLLSQYLTRNHQWRHKQLTVRDRGLCITNGIPFESHNLFNSYFGNNTSDDLGQWFKDATNSANSYLFAFGKGSGNYDVDHNVGFSSSGFIGQQNAYTTNFAVTPIYAVFDRMYGSYYGDWDSGIHSNVYQAPLANAGYGLTVMYSEITLPVDTTSIGEPIGQESYAAVANVYVNWLARYYGKGYFFSGVSQTNTESAYNYMSLMGDPTLRARVVAPPTNVIVTVDGLDKLISWGASTDSNLQGYHVYRAPSTDLNSFTRLTTTPVAGPYRDVGATSASYKYMVRAVKLDGATARSFYNASQGILSGSTTFTNYYADNTATGGLNNGTSWTDAWTNLAGVVWGNSGVKAGDTLYISGGSTSQIYTQTLNITASGTSSNPITIRAGQDSGHNGTVLIDGSAWGVHCLTNAITCYQDYLVINGEYNGQRHFIVHDWFNSTNKNVGFGYGIASAPNAYHMTVLYTEFTNNNTGIYDQSCSNMVIGWCKLMNIGDANIAINDSRVVPPNNWDSSLIFSNEIYCVFSTAPGDPPGTGGPDGIQGGNGVSIFNNHIETIEDDSITNRVSNHIDFWQSDGNSWLKIYNNDCLNDGDSMLSPAPFSAGHGLNNVRIYNNIFRITKQMDPFPQYIRMYNSSGFGGFTNVYILNNLFIDRTNGTQAVYFGNELGTSPGTGNVMANNIFVNCSALSTAFQWEYAPPDAGTISAWTFTNNLYYTTNPANSVLKFTGTNYTVAQWKANTDPSTITNLPVFTSYTFMSPANNYHLQASDTAAIGRGLNYSSIFTTDKDGNTRGSVWDLGPFQFTSNAPAGSGTFSAGTIRAGRVSKP